jgi:hypothetical protein
MTPEGSAMSITPRSEPGHNTRPLAEKGACDVGALVALGGCGSRLATERAANLDVRPDCRAQRALQERLLGSRITAIARTSAKECDRAQWMSEAMSSPPLLAITLVSADDVRSFSVQPTSPTGWETCERDGQHFVRRRRYTDWHRVEQALARFAREIEELKKQGWREADG